MKTTILATAVLIALGFSAHAEEDVKFSDTEVEATEVKSATDTSKATKDDEKVKAEAEAKADADAKKTAAAVRSGALLSETEKLFFISPFEIFKPAYPAAPIRNIQPLLIQYQCTCPPDLEIWKRPLI